MGKKEAPRKAAGQEKPRKRSETRIPGHLACVTLLLLFPLFSDIKIVKYSTLKH